MSFVEDSSVFGENAIALWRAVSSQSCIKAPVSVQFIGLFSSSHREAIRFERYLF